MSQEDVYRVLKKNKGKWMTTQDIANNLYITRHNVSSNLRKLKQDKSIKNLELKETWRFKDGGWLWRLK